MAKEKNKNQIKNLENNTGNIPQIPELYANAALANISPYECELTLGLGSSTFAGIKPVVNIR